LVEKQQVGVPVLPDEPREFFLRRDVLKPDEHPSDDRVIVELNPGETVRSKEEIGPVEASAVTTAPKALT
jgi:hypothetical protein